MFLWLLVVTMDTLPIELVTIIATDTFELFTTLLRVNTIGQRLCAEYPQLVAKEKFICEVKEFGYKHTYLNNQLHSFNDQPAIVYTNHQKWYRYGELHRGNDLPAIIYKNGRKCWFWNGQRHRGGNLPAVEDKHAKEWHIHGKFIY